MSPIDFGWENLKTLSETIYDISKQGSFLSNDVDTDGVNSFLNNWNFAKAEAKKCGWEGDFRNTPNVFWLPSEESFSYGFVFKHENNGTTFIISPFPLPWIESIQGTESHSTE